MSNDDDRAVTLTDGTLSSITTSNSRDTGTSRPLSNGHDAVQDDVNPRSPKRRRLSPSDDDSVLDVGAAAARALALSLGKEDGNIAQPVKNLVDQESIIPQSQILQSGATSSTRPEAKNRLDDLPALGDLALQILSFLARLNHLEIGEMLFGPPSPRGLEYRALKQKFDEAKKPFILSASPFLSAHALGVRENPSLDMMRRVNLAIFMASIFSGEIGLRIMDINFIEVFVPEGGRLLKAQGSIYLELKTHAFMAATRTASTMLNQVMMDLFPLDMDKHLLQRRPGAKGLAPSEQDFLNRLGSRRDILYSVIRSNKLSTLPDTYRWNDFAREVSIYLTKHMESTTSAGKENADGGISTTDAFLQQQQHMIDAFPPGPGTTNTSNESTSRVIPTSDLSSSGLDCLFDIEAMIAQAARTAALSIGDGIDMTLLPATANTPSTETTSAKDVARQSLISGPPVAESAHEPLPDLESVTEGQLHDDLPRLLNETNNTTPTPAGDEEVPHQSQTAPTQVLYERARQVNTNKALATKKIMPPTHRRPWTTEEENALMTGLDQVKGPHWSQILAMYGPGGTVNESLKDRNQVQLKDKARNLKLFFLKASIEVPYYLQAVTGDLKTRAPGQAEKLEREKLQGEGDRLLDETQGTAEPPDFSDGDNVSSSDATPLDRGERDAGVGDLPIEPAFDMEAMIAQAAASASEGIKAPHWRM